MRKNSHPHWQVTDLPSSLFVFIVLGLFTYGILFRAPYLGFDFSTGDGRVMEIFIQQEPSLQKGDILVKAGNILWTDYKGDSRQPLFEDFEAGETVQITVIRNGAEVTVPWRVPGHNDIEFSRRVFNVWELAYIFWAFGAVTQLAIRPRNARSRLFIAFNYLTALLLIFGSFSATHLWESSVLMRVVSWLILPVYLHLNWIFPRPFMELSKTAWFLFYLICVSFALAEFVQAPPRGLYALIFLAALTGSILLQIVHFIRQPDQRRDISLLFLLLLVAFAPSIGLAIFVVGQRIPDLAPAALLALPLMPLAVFYVVQRRRLGGLEIRINRAISLYAYMTIVGTVLIFCVVHLDTLNLTTEKLYFMGSVYALSLTFLAVVGFSPFQKFVEKRFFGIKLPYQNLQEIYSSRITTSTSMPSLLQLLEDEIFPSLLVRQYVFVQVLNKELKILLTKNVDAEQLSHKCGVDELIGQAGKFFPEILNCDWVRLILPLKVGDRFIGFWLLGQRDPDDHYPQAEIPTLQSIANQTAIALSNIDHAEQVRKMYQSDIERNEQERMSLALELHDSVLNELAVLRASVGEASLPPQFQTSYEEVARRLREIVSDLRPPMLMYGLVPALNGLADNLMQRSGDKVTIKADIQSGEERLPQNMEWHLYRIAQEACENSLRHARAENIVIRGEITSRKLDLTITDDGTGFEPQTELGSLIASRHFGLAGMVERAHLLGAEINIKSMPAHGTTIHISWVNNTEQS